MAAEKSTDHIPTQGVHRGDPDIEKTGTSVRAPEPGEGGPVRYRLRYHDEDEHYVLDTGGGASSTERLGRGWKSLGEFDDLGAARAALHTHADRQEGFAVIDHDDPAVEAWNDIFSRDIGEAPVRFFNDRESADAYLQARMADRYPR